MSGPRGCPDPSPLAHFREWPSFQHQILTVDGLDLLYAWPIVTASMHPTACSFHARHPAGTPVLFILSFSFSLSLSSGDADLMQASF